MNRLAKDQLVDNIVCFWCNFLMYTLNPKTKIFFPKKVKTLNEN